MGDSGGSTNAPGSEYKNHKRDAIKAVYDTIETEADELGANAVGEGTKPKTLTEGLGYGGDLWDSPAADGLAESMQEVIRVIIDDFTRERDDVYDDWRGEPESTDYHNPRSTWNGKARVPYTEDAVSI